MLNIDTAVVPTLGEGGLRVINPSDTSNTDHNLNRTTFLGHEAEAHYHSLDYVFTPAYTEKGEELVECTKNKCG